MRQLDTQRVYSQCSISAVDPLYVVAADAAAISVNPQQLHYANGPPVEEERYGDDDAIYRSDKHIDVISSAGAAGGEKVSVISASASRALGIPREEVATRQHWDDSHHIVILIRDLDAMFHHHPGSFVRAAADA